MKRHMLCMPIHVKVDCKPNVKFQKHWNLRQSNHHLELLFLWMNHQKFHSKLSVTKDLLQDNPNQAMPLFFPTSITTIFCAGTSRAFSRSC